MRAPNKSRWLNRGEGTQQWDKHTFRFQITSGKKEIIYREHPLIDREKIMLPVSINLMICSLGVDTSRKEIFYETLWSFPMPSNDIVDFSSG